MALNTKLKLSNFAKDIKEEIAFAVSALRELAQEE